MNSASFEAVIPKRSAGLLLYRRCGGGVEVLLAHPGGPLFKKKDAGAWSIPKGQYSEEEDAFAAAVREFEEETGIKPEGRFVPLTPVRQAGGKLVTAWALEGDCDPAAIRSNSFTMEWPPGSGHMQQFPEIDRVEWFPLDAARAKINPGQVGLLDQLEDRIRESG